MVRRETKTSSGSKLIEAESWIRKAKPNSFAPNAFKTNREALELAREMKKLSCKVFTSTREEIGVPDEADSFEVHCSSARSYEEALDLGLSYNPDEVIRQKRKLRFYVWWD